MRTDLNVPYADKDRAKRRGARWDVARKTWFVENVENLQAFSRRFKPEHAKPCDGREYVEQVAHLRSILKHG